MNEAQWERTKLVAGTLAALLAVGSQVVPRLWTLATDEMTDRLVALEQRVWQLENPGAQGPAPRGGR